MYVPLSIFQALLEDVTDDGKEFLQAERLRNSLTLCSSAEASACNAERVGGLQIQKMTTESVNEHLQTAPLTGNPRVHNVREEASLLHTELRVWAEIVGVLSETEPDLKQLTQQGRTIQVTLKHPLKSHKLPQ